MRESLLVQGKTGCPHDGSYGVRKHLVIAGRCSTCEGEEAARRARLEERGIFLGR